MGFATARSKGRGGLSIVGHATYIWPVAGARVPTVRAAAACVAHVGLEGKAEASATRHLLVIVPLDLESTFERTCILVHGHKAPAGESEQRRFPPQQSDSDRLRRATWKRQRVSRSQDMAKEHTVRKRPPRPAHQKAVPQARSGRKWVGAHACLWCQAAWKCDTYRQPFFSSFPRQ